MTRFFFLFNFLCVAVSINSPELPDGWVTERPLLGLRLCLQISVRAVSVCLAPGVKAIRQYRSVLRVFFQVALLLTVLHVIE